MKNEKRLSLMNCLSKSKDTRGERRKKLGQLMGQQGWRERMRERE